MSEELFVSTSPDGPWKHVPKKTLRPIIIGESMSDWINVDERLPEDIVLVHFRNGTMGVAFWSERQQMWDFGPEQHAAEKITHWRPLPEPPQTTEEG